jgi:signal transduction histidine kinase
MDPVTQEMEQELARLEVKNRELTQGIEYQNEQVSQIRQELARLEVKNRKLTRGLEYQKEQVSLIRQQFSHAEERNQKLSHLLGSTHNSISTRITVFEGYLEYSESYVNDPNRITDIIRKLRDAVDELAYINGSIRVSHAPGVNVFPTWHNINEEVRKEADAALRLRGIPVVVDCPDLAVYADPLFEKVFPNLIDNALRHGGDGLTRIRISAHETDDGLTLVCEDDGAGISDEERKFLFTHVFGRHKGRGLNIVREVLSITGITIRETGSYGKGARFEMMVPEGAFLFPARE